MKPKLNYNKKFMNKVNDILNKIEKTQEPQSIAIYNIDNNCCAQFICNNFDEIAYVHYSIATGLDEFPCLNQVDEKQHYLIALNSQEIESIIRRFDGTTYLNPESVEHQLFKGILLPVINGLKKLLEK